jgi:hypothetical protein
MKRRESFLLDSLAKSADKGEAVRCFFVFSTREPDLLTKMGPTMRRR